MRKCYPGLALAAMLCAASPLFAQTPSLGVYFDQEGSQVTKFLTVEYPDFQPFNAYVIVFWEASVGGASYRLHLDPRIQLYSASYPGGVQIGDPLDDCGVEVGLSFPGFGFNGTPVMISTLVLFTNSTIYDGLICVQRHCNYDHVIVADAAANIFPCSGNCSFLTQVVGTEERSWGSVKSLYR